MLIGMATISVSSIFDSTPERSTPTTSPVCRWLCWVDRLVCFSAVAGVLMMALAWWVEPALDDPTRSARWWAALAFYVRTFQAHMGLLFAIAAAWPLVRRRWRSALVTLTCAAALGSVDLRRSLQSTPPTAGESVRIFSMNLLRPNRQVDAVYAQIQREQPDIVVFQEFSRLHQERFDLGLLRTHPNRLTFPAYDYRGLAVYSRWPIELELGPDAGTPHERFMVVRVLHPTGTIRLVNMHPASPAGPRRIAENRAQVKWVIDLVAPSTMPTILAGDFNCTLNSQQAGALRGAGFFAASEQGGGGWWRTWSPFGLLPPVVGIDHVFSSHHFTAKSVAVMEPAGSDHRGISVVLSLK